tara:strand:- start:51 stop:347 length:297 start_codon:yes stop_codon:yes gene_type:complete
MVPPAGFFEDAPTPRRSSNELPTGPEETFVADDFGADPGPGDKRSSNPANPSTTGSACVTDDSRDDPELFDLALSTALSRSVAQSASPPLNASELFCE